MPNMKPLRPFADDSPQGDSESFEPMPRERLPDRLARRIQVLIQSGARGDGERLPAIGEMARRFGVGHQSVREALKKLETMGVVEIRHGSGVYVRQHDEEMSLSDAAPARELTAKTLLELTLDIRDSLARGHEELVAILEAIERGDEALARSRMQEHLQGVHKALTHRDSRMRNASTISGRTAGNAASTNAA